MTRRERLLLRAPARYPGSDGAQIVSGAELECGHPKKYPARDPEEIWRTRNVAEVCDHCAELPHPITNPAAWDEARRKRVKR